jgi:rhodanese-related sulfurtransferase
MLSLAEACGTCGCSEKKTSDTTSCASGACSLADTQKKSASNHSRGHTLTTVQMVKAVEAQQATIIDARPKKYDNGERIPGAIQLAPNASEAVIKSILPNKNAAIITYCGNTKCPASKQLAARLKLLGYTHVREYPAGIAGWKAAGGTVEKAK